MHLVLTLGTRLHCTQFAKQKNPEHFKNFRKHFRIYLHLANFNILNIPKKHKYFECWLKNQKLKKNRTKSSKPESANSYLLTLHKNQFILIFRFFSIPSEGLKLGQILILTPYLNSYYSQNPVFENSVSKIEICAVVGKWR